MKALLIGLIAVTTISSAVACQDMNPNNRASTTTWTTLYGLKQVGSNFKDSGRILINDLPELTGGNSGMVALADQIHRVITVGRGARSISGNNEVLSAINEASKNNETVCDLAKRLDEKYNFWNE